MRRMESIQGRTERLRELALELPASVRECIEACNDCHQACEQVIPHCLELGGELAEVSHIRLIQDCAQITSVAADFMMRESGFHARFCALCADVCLACAGECERLEDEDELLRSCANACRRCADSCAPSARKH